MICISTSCFLFELHQGQQSVCCVLSPFFFYFLSQLLTVRATISPLLLPHLTFNFHILYAKFLKQAAFNAFRSQVTRTRMVSTTASPADSLVTCQATWWLKSPWTMSTSSTRSCSRASSLWTTRPQVSPLTSHGTTPCS